MSKFNLQGERKMGDKYREVFELFNLSGVLNSDISSTDLKLIKYFDGTTEIEGQFITSAIIADGDTLLTLTSDDLLGTVLPTPLYTTVGFALPQNDSGAWTLIPAAFGAATNTVVVEGALISGATCSFNFKIFRRIMENQGINLVGVSF